MPFRQTARNRKDNVVSPGHEFSIVEDHAIRLKSTALNRIFFQLSGKRCDSELNGPLAGRSSERVQEKETVPLCSTRFPNRNDLQIETIPYSNRSTKCLMTAALVGVHSSPSPNSALVGMP